MTGEFIGDAFIRIRPGGEQEFERELQQQIDPVVSRIGSSLDTADLQGFNRSLRETGDFMTRNVTPAALGLAAASGILFRSWDQGQDTIQAGTGATGEALDDLLAVADEVADRVPTAFNEIGEVVTQLNRRLGLTGPILEDVTQQIVELRELPQGASASIETLVRVLQEWRIETLQQAGALDLLFRASQRSGTTVSDIAESVVAARPILEQFGFTFEETVALAAQLGPLFSTVVTGIRTASSDLSRSGARDIPAALDQAITSIREAADETEALTRSIEVFGGRAGPQLATLIREGRLELRDFTEEIKSGTGTIHDAATDIRDLPDFLLIIRNRFQSMVGPTIQWAAAFGTIAAGAGPAMIGLSRVMGPIVDRIQGVRAAAALGGRELGVMGAAGELAGNKLRSIRIGSALAVGGLTLLVGFIIDRYLGAMNQAQQETDELGQRLTQSLGSGVSAARRLMAEFQREVGEATPVAGLEIGAGLIENLRGGTPELRALRDGVADLRETAAALEGTEREVTLAQAEWRESTINLAVAQANAATSSEDLTALQEAQRIAAEALIAAVREQDDALGGVTGATDELASSSQNLESTQKSLAQIERERTRLIRTIEQAHRDAAQAARDQRLAELSLAGGLLGIQGASLSAEDAEGRLASARRRVNRLADQDRQGTVAYKDALNELEQAQLGAVGGQLGLAEAVAQYINENAGSNASTATAIGLIEEYGAMAGLTREEIDRLTREVQSLIERYRDLPVSKTTDAAFEDRRARRQIDAYIRKIQEVPETVTTTAQFGPSGAGGTSTVSAPTPAEIAATIQRTQELAAEGGLIGQRQKDKGGRNFNAQVVIDGKVVQESNTRRKVLL